MARFWMGSYLRHLKLLPTDRRTPVSFSLPLGFYQKFLKSFKLEQEELSVLTNHRQPSTVWRKVNHHTLPLLLQPEGRSRKDHQPLCCLGRSRRPREVKSTGGGYGRLASL